MEQTDLSRGLAKKRGPAAMKLAAVPALQGCGAGVSPGVAPGGAAAPHGVAAAAGS